MVRELLHHLHDRVVIGERLVALERRELRIVVQVDAFVTEYPPDFVHLLEAADDKSLEVEFGRDAEEELSIECVVMRLERVSHAPCRYLHQHRSLDLKEISAVHEPSDRADDLTALNGDLPGLGVGDQVEIPLSEASLDVGKAVPFFGQRS